MWAVFGAALLALIRKQRYLSIARWRFVHGALALLVVVSSVVHALLIEGTMGTLSKVMLCAVALLVTLWTMIDLRVWSIRLFNRSKI